MANEERFRHMWAKTKRVHGALTEVEARQLFDMAMGLKSPAEIVEVGTFHGRSASMLGQVAWIHGHHLTCVDSFVGVPKGSPYEKRGTGIDHVLGNLNNLGIRFTLMMMPSVDAARRYNRHIDLLFVDSDHSREGATLDCNAWLPKLVPGGLAMFHDARSADPRKRVGPVLTRWVRTHKNYEVVEVPDMSSRVLRRVE